MVKASLETMIYNTVRTGVNRALPVWTVHRYLGEKHFQRTLGVSSEVSGA